MYMYKENYSLLSSVYDCNVSSYEFQQRNLESEKNKKKRSCH